MFSYRSSVSSRRDIVWYPRHQRLQLLWKLYLGKWRPKEAKTWRSAQSAASLITIHVACVWYVMVWIALIAAIAIRHISYLMENNESIEKKRRCMRHALRVFITSRGDGPIRKCRKCGSVFRPGEQVDLPHSIMWTGIGATACITCAVSAHLSLQGYGKLSEYRAWAADRLRRWRRIKRNNVPKI